MTIFNLLPRIEVWSSGIWPIELPELAESNTTTPLTDLHFMELDEPDPNMIGVGNSGTFPALIPPGLIIGGLDQNRMVPFPTVVPAGMTIGVEVFCVEQSRFGGRAQQYLGGRAPIQFWLDREPNPVSVSPIRRRNPAIDQPAIWDQIRQLSDRSDSNPDLALDRLLTTGVGHPMTPSIDAGWGRSTAFALEIQGSLLRIEMYANQKDAQYMAFSTARCYLKFAPDRNLGLTRDKVQKLTENFFAKDFRSSPRRDFHFEEIRGTTGEVLFAELTNYQNRLLTSV